MATTYKILGQGTPTTTNGTTLYTVPSTTTQTVVSTVTICNTSTAPTGAYLYVGKGSAAASTSNALIYNSSIQPNTTVTVTIGLTLSNTASVVDNIYCGSSTSSGNLTFTLSGSEIA